MTIRPVTAELWPALEDLFGKAGACNGCWCMYWRMGPARRSGVMAALIAEALRVAKRAGAPAVEAYPIDTSAPKSTSNIFTGTMSTFRRAGFKILARRAADRPIMRYAF